MLKKGFTLAEVLITLSIVGVIAAVTLPTFVSSTTRAQIGPKLGKAAAMLEQANMALLDEFNVDSFTDSGLITVQNAGITLTNNYINRLSNHLKIDPNTYITNDGVQYAFTTDAGVIPYEQASQYPNANPPHNRRIGTVTIDIDGPDSGPGQAATDIFYFSWWDDGSLRPAGADNWMIGDPANTSWRLVCQADMIPTNANYCAGHIYANNMKVLYK